MPLGAILWAVVSKVAGLIYNWSTLTGDPFYSIPFGADETLTALDIAGSIVFWWVLCVVVISRMVQSGRETY